GGHVPGGALPDRVAGDRRSAGQRAVGEAAHHLGGGRLDPLGPHIGAGAVVQGDLLGGQQREELVGAHAEQVPEGTRVAAEADLVVLVDDAGEVGDRHCGAVLGGGGDVGRVLVGDQVQGGHQHQVVAGQVAAGRQHVHRDPAVPQVAVQGADPVAVADVLAG